MKTRAHITTSRRPLASTAPEGRPMARPSGPAVIMGGGLGPYGANAVPNGCRGPREPYLTALSLGGYRGCGGETRTRDLLVMSQAGCHCPTPLKMMGGAHLLRSLHAVLKSMNLVDERQATRLIGFEPCKPDSVHVSSGDGAAGEVDNALHHVGIRPAGSTLDTGERTAGINPIDTESPRRFGEAQPLRSAPVRKLHAPCKP